MRYNDKEVIDAFKKINSPNVIPSIEQLIEQEKTFLAANVILQDRHECLNVKDRIADLRIILNLLRTELRS